MSGHSKELPSPANSQARQPFAPNRWVAAAFGAVGVVVLVASMQLPSGIGALPGPGFFPFVLAILILCFALFLGWESRAVPKPDFTPAPLAHSWLLPAVTAAVLVLYVASWEWLPFLVRTPLLILLLMRLSGASWWATGLGSVLLPAVLYAIFQLGLRVDLG